MHKNKDKCKKKKKNIYIYIWELEQHVKYLRVRRFKLLDTNIYGTACTLINEKNSPAIHDLKNCVKGSSYNYIQN
jgi:hypothetical protein